MPSCPDDSHTCRCDGTQRGAVGDAHACRRACVWDDCSVIRPCERCGADMRLVPDSDWTLYEVMTVDYICPNCLHTERVRVLPIEKGE